MNNLILADRLNGIITRLEFNAGFISSRIYPGKINKGAMDDIRHDIEYLKEIKAELLQEPKEHTMEESPVAGCCCRMCDAHRAAKQ